jgi:hypothetical protein
MGFWLIGFFIDFESCFSRWAEFVIRPFYFHGFAIPIHGLCPHRPYFASSCLCETDYLLSCFSRSWTLSVGNLTTGQPKYLC